MLEKWTLERNVIAARRKRFVLSVKRNVASYARVSWSYDQKSLMSLFASSPAAEVLRQQTIEKLMLP